MKRSFARSPYLWTILGAVTVVIVAWAGRERYQPVITGEVAPDFVARAMDGTDVAISDYADKVVLVNIWATWCGPCKMIAPIIEELANDYAGRIKVGKLDADTEQKTAAEFQVRGLPTVLIFKDGKVADSVVGAAAKAQYVEKLEAVL